MRYFLVDKVTAYTPGESASGVKSVTLSDEILHDHFPDYPILPGALIVEALAQLGGFALEIDSARPKERAILTQIERAKFHAPVGPGDQLRLEVRVEQSAWKRRRGCTAQPWSASARWRVPSSPSC
jgi:3-hydroxyacyl-[acyl-carrier-protein] dehydratase